MELGLSALTRRDRLERIAAAERDRRAGSIELAIASLGEGTEWPARVVLALAHLPVGTSAETRAILEKTLDDWAAESGLDPLCQGDAILEASPVVDGEDPEPELEIEEGVFFDAETPLGAPIDNFELDQAFEQAEVQVEEMRDVNTVAERVLMDEPTDLAELTGAAIDPFIDPNRDSPQATDAAWSEGSIWPEAPAYPEGTGAGFDAEPAGNPLGATVSADAQSLFGEPQDSGQRPTASPVAEGFAAVTDHASDSAETQVLATLERWLGNLERTRRERIGARGGL